MNFLEPDRFFWILILPALTAVALFAALRHRRNLHRFATPERLDVTFPVRSRMRGVIRSLLLLSGLALVLVALADPRRGERERETPPGNGVSVVFALDVSRSMLAQDVSPTRLDRAKQYVRELTRVLQAREDDASVGLVAFAGVVKRVAPVTRNVGELELALQATDTTSAGVGGSNLADAVQVAARSFVDRRPGHKVVVMLTDGEENLSGEPAAAAQTAFEERGVRFFPLGIGSPDTGATIPLGNGRVMMHDGNPVQTTLDAAALKTIAKNGGGVYLPAETKRADMDEIYRRVIRPRLNAGNADGDAAATTATKVKVMIPRFGWFAWPALVLLLVERLIAGWPARRAAGPVAAATCLCLLPGLAVAQEPQTDALAAYNAAVAARDVGDLDAAQDGFAQAARRGVGTVEARARYNLARAAHKRALALVSQESGAQAEAVVAPEAVPPTPAAPPSDADPIPLLDEAVREYAAALGADAAFDDARANLEAAARLREKLRQQQQQEQEQEQKQEQKQEPSDDQKPQDGESAEQEPQESSEDQESGEDSEGDPDSESGDNPPQQGGSDADEQEPAPGEGDENESSASDASEPDEPSDTTAGSDTPESASPPPDTEGEDPAAAEAAETSEGEPGTEAQALSPDEAMKLLQRIRDQDLQRRIAQYQRDARRQQRVEKDW